MARLPNPGGDNGNWGTILNDYLSQVHNPNGTLKNDVVTSSAIADNAVNATSIADGSITEALLSSSVQTKLNQTASTWSTISGKPAVVAAGADAEAARSVVAAVGKGELVINAADYGAKGDGSTNDTVSLQSALDAVPDGGTLHIPAGRYNVYTTLVSTGKSITISADGATLVQNANTSVLTLSGSWGAVQNVSSMDTSQFQPDGATSSLRCTVFTLGASPGWAVGDVIKLFANDVIPGGRPVDSGTARRRVGQFFVVWKISGNTVTVSGRPLDSYTSNLRLVRLEKKTAKVHGLHIESSDPVNFNNSGLTLRSLYQPEADVTFGGMPQVCLATKSCYAPNITMVADKSNNNPSTDQEGYALLDISSEHGYYNITAGHVRHAYTDDTNTTESGDNDPSRYGRSYGHTVTGRAYGTSSNAWSPHNQSRGITFTDCTVANSYGGFGLRGLDHNVFNSVIDYCTAGLFIFDEDSFGTSTSADSWGHQIDGLIIRNCRGSDFQIRIQTNVHTGVDQGVRITAHPIMVRNVTIEGVVAGAISVTNHTVHLQNINILAAVTLDDDTAVVTTINSDVTIRNLVADYRQNTAGEDFVFFKDSTTASVVRASQLSWRYEAGAVSRITTLAVGIADSTRWDISDAEVDYSFGLPFTVSGADGSKIDCFARDTGDNRAYVTVSTSTIASASVPLAISQSRLPTVYAVCTPSNGSRIIDVLKPGAFKGQRLIVVNAYVGAYTITVRHGVSYLTSNTGAANVVLAQDESATWFWNGTVWRQTSHPVSINDFSASTLVTSTETITANNNDTTIPTSAAVMGELANKVDKVATANRVYIVDSGGAQSSRQFTSSSTATTIVTRDSSGRAQFVDPSAAQDAATKAYVDARILRGSGTPEATIVASVGTLYLRTDGGAGTTLYVKESGAGNTGWSAK